MGLRWHTIILKMVAVLFLQRFEVTSAAPSSPLFSCLLVWLQQICTSRSASTHRIINNAWAAPSRAFWPPPKPFQMQAQCNFINATTNDRSMLSGKGTEDPQQRLCKETWAETLLKLKMSRDHLSDGNKNGAFKKQFGFWVHQQQQQWAKTSYYVDVGCIVIYISFRCVDGDFWMNRGWGEDGAL